METMIVLKREIETNVLKIIIEYVEKRYYI